ncbi:branched-chain amino acid ABC transporter permease [soil metagenome]
MAEFVQFVAAGLAVGAQYSLIVLGFVVIYRATGIINFAQGGLVVLGAYLAYNATNTWGLPFPLAVVIAMAGGAAVGALVELLILRRMIGEPVFAVIMITIGLLFVLEEVVTSVWGPDNLNLGDPWGVRSTTVGEVTLSLKDIYTVALAAIVLAAFFWLFRYTRFGVAMRATASDQEAALAQGISARRVVALSWAVAGAVAALAGVTAGAGSIQVRPTLGGIALFAFPAMILGGLDSPGGAVLGGLIIGVTQVLTAGYQHEYAPWLGQGFESVMPYVVMIAVLMLRPFGLFGTREVRRI